MASSTAADHPAKKAGYWFSTSELQVADINPNHFTHLYAGFAKVQYPITPDQKIDDVIKFPDNSGRFESFPQTVKRGNPRVKALLSIGGEGSDDISRAIAAVAINAEDGLRDRFITQSIKLARKHAYDGLDLCWLYPSNANEQTHLASFLSDWRHAVDDEAARLTNRPKLLLTAAVFHHPVIQGTDGNNIDYPCQAISKNLDWINVLTIDFDAPSPSNSPGKTGPVDAWLVCGKAGILDWKGRDVPTENLVFGLPFHGYNHGNEHHDDIAAKVKEAFRGINLGGYCAWHLASDDENWTLSNAASNAMDKAHGESTTIINYDSHDIIDSHDIDSHNVYPPPPPPPSRCNIL